MSTYPAHWTPSAIDVVAAVTAARPDISGAEAAMLGEAAELISTADALMVEAREAGLSSTGSTGQTVASPLVVEARLTRAAAVATLSKLVPKAPAKGSRGGDGRFMSNMGGTGTRR